MMIRPRKHQELRRRRDHDGREQAGIERPDQPPQSERGGDKNQGAQGNRQSLGALRDIEAVVKDRHHPVRQYRFV